SGPWKRVSRRKNAVKPGLGQSSLFFSPLLSEPRVDLAPRAVSIPPVREPHRIPPEEVPGGGVAHPAGSDSRLYVRLARLGGRQSPQGQRHGDGSKGRRLRPSSPGRHDEAESNG